MAKFDVIDLEGKKISDIDLDDRIFSAEVNTHLLWESVRHYRASLRAGTHSTLRRSEVRGGGRKPYAQKGTGRARQGSIRSPQFVGGGSVFGPKPRDYSYNLPKQVKAAALRGVLSLKAKEGKLIIVQDLSFSVIKTKAVVKAMEKLKFSSALLVDTAENLALAKSTQNVHNYKHVPSTHMVVYDVLDHDYLVLTLKEVEAIQARLAV